MPPVPPRITGIVVRYTFADRFSVGVKLDNGDTFVLDLTADQYRRTRNSIVDTGSAPIPTGENV